MEKAHDLSKEKRTSDVILEENIKFRDMLLSESTLAGLEAAGFRKPSPIQKKAIPLGRCGYDVLVQSKSGTGKTCVFSVIAMEMLIPASKTIQVLIIAPTREICIQISNVIRSLTQSMGKMKVESFIGGLPIKEDKNKLSKCQVAVGTPGRVKHLISHGLMNVQYVRLFVLDEADRLMEDNFRKDISYIYSKLPSVKQTIAASATFSDELEKFVMDMMKKPIKVNLGKDTILLGVRQFAAIIPYHPSVFVQMKNKTAELIKILSRVSFKQCLVFSNYQSRSESICYELTKEGWPAIHINGSQVQNERLKVLDMLKSCQCRVLVSTDLTSRGIDAENVNLIVNLDLPFDEVTYLHRLGRSGRYGTHAVTVTIVQDGDEIERFRHLLHKIGGENFYVNVFPDEKQNIDVWNESDENFKKLFSLPGEYKFVKYDKKKENESIDIHETKSEDSISIVRLNQIPRPRNLTIDDFEILQEELMNFKIIDREIETTEGKKSGFVTDIPSDVESSLVQMEKEGWNQFHMLRELPKNVGLNENKEEINMSSCESITEDSLYESESRFYKDQEFSTFSNSLEENDDEEEEISFEHFHCDHELSQTYLSKNINNWYAMWLRQTRHITHYVQYYHYWKEMNSFS